MARKPKNLEEGAPSPESGSVQQKVTITQQQKAVVREIAKFSGRKEIDVMKDAFRRGLPLVYQEHVTFKEAVDRLNSNTILRSLLIRMAAGESISDEEIIEAGYDADIDATTLKKIRDCLSQRRNGDVHVHQD